MIANYIKKLLKKEASCFELVSNYLEKAKNSNKTLNAFITISTDYALQKAKETDNLIKQQGKEIIKSKPLLGIPFGIKDIFSTKDIQTTAASKILKGYIPPYSSTVVNKLEQAGAIIIGKLNCDAFAHGASGENSDFGPAKNPYNIAYVPGGSSSGSGVSVSANMCIASTATDTGGSIRSPACNTNTFGLKPTYGLVSRFGIIAMASSTDSIGHITKMVEDSAEILSITSGKDPLDATSVDRPAKNYTKFIKMGIKNIRIGVVKEFMESKLDPEVKQVNEKALHALYRNGALIEEVHLPHVDKSLAVYYILQTSEVSSNLARFDGIRFGHTRDYFGSEAKRRILLGTYTLSSGYYDDYYLKALKVRTLIINDFKNAFSKFDLLLQPNAPSLPPKIGQIVNDPLEMYLQDIFMTPVNLAGLPAVSVPAGFSKSGLPIGTQLIANHFREDLLFRASYVLERELQMYKHKPIL